MNKADMDEIMALVSGIAEQAGCNDAEEFQDFFLTVLRHAGLIVGMTDLSNWDAILTKRETAERSRARALNLLRVDLEKYKREIAELKIKIAVFAETNPNVDFSSLGESFVEEARLLLAERRQHYKEVMENWERRRRDKEKVPADPTADLFDDW